MQKNGLLDENLINLQHFLYSDSFHQRNRSSRIEAKIQSDHSENIFNRFLTPKLVYRLKIRSIFIIFDFRTLFHQRNRSSRVEARIKSDHSTTIYNRFLIKNWFIGRKLDQFASFLFSDSFSSTEPIIKNEDQNQVGSL